MPFSMFKGMNKLASDGSLSQYASLLSGHGHTYIVDNPGKVTGAQFCGVPDMFCFSKNNRVYVCTCV